MVCLGARGTAYATPERVTKGDLGRLAASSVVVTGDLPSILLRASRVKGGDDCRLLKPGPAS